METTRRRHPRLNLPPNITEQFPALEAAIVWPNHEMGRVVDLSHRGFGVRRPGLWEVAAHQSLAIRMRLPLTPEFVVQARVAWITFELVGLEMTHIPPEGQVALAEYLQVPLLGRQLKAVSEKNFGPEQTFQEWLQGPNDTHVFIWRDPTRQKIAKVSVHRSDTELEFIRRQVPNTQMAATRQALLLLSQLDGADRPMTEFVLSLGQPQEE